MKIIMKPDEGKYPWWVGRKIKFKCGLIVELELGDSDMANVYINDHEATVVCSHCGEQARIKKES